MQSHSRRYYEGGHKFDCTTVLMPCPICADFKVACKIGNHPRGKIDSYACNYRYYLSFVHRFLWYLFLFDSHILEVKKMSRQNTQVSLAANPEERWSFWLEMSSLFPPFLRRRNWSLLLKLLSQCRHLENPTILAWTLKGGPQVRLHCLLLTFLLKS